MVSIPGVSCKSVEEAKSTLEEAGFKVREYPDQVPSTCAAGTVAYTKPTGQAPKNGLVTLFISNGQAPPPDPSMSPKPGGGGPTKPPDPEPTCKPNEPFCGPNPNNGW
jgi:beta-lactam-binding protein with PASTA domain